MDMALLLAFIVAALFALAYFTKRRFGLLGLALCAGALLSEMWTADVTPLIREAGIQLLAPPLSMVVAVALVLLPAVLMLFTGPKYSKMWQRILGAAMFALLTTAFILIPLGSSVVLDDTTREYYEILVKYKNFFITGAIAFALLDILTFKPKKDKDKK